MKKQELETIITENTQEGVMNFDNMAKIINDHVNDISNRNIEKAKESYSSEVSANVRNKFVQEYGFENVDQFSAFVKNNKATTDENKEALQRIQVEYNKSIEENKSLTQQFQDVNSKLTHIENLNLAKNKGIKNDMLDYAIFEAQKVVNDELSLEDVLDGFKESKPMLFNEQQKQRIKVGGKVKEVTTTKDEVKEKLQKKYPWLK